MERRIAYIVHASADKKRYICIDAPARERIMKFLCADAGRLKKYRYIVALILQNIRNTELYGKEDINGSINDVYAMKLFRGGDNIRLYCKQVSGPGGQFFVIVTELLEKKKTTKNNAAIQSLIKKVHSYEYEILEYPESR